MDNFIFIPPFKNIDSAIEYLKNEDLFNHKFSSNLSRFTPEKDLLNWVVCCKVIATIQDAFDLDYGRLNWNGAISTKCGGLSSLNPYTNFSFSYESCIRKLCIQTNYRPSDIHGNDIQGMSLCIAFYRRCTDVFANMFGLYCARYGDYKGKQLLAKINEILAIK